MAEVGSQQSQGVPAQTVQVDVSAEKIGLKEGLEPVMSQQEAVAGALGSQVEAAPPTQPEQIGSQAAAAGGLQPAVEATQPAASQPAASQPAASQPAASQALSQQAASQAGTEAAADPCKEASSQPAAAP